MWSLFIDSLVRCSFRSNLSFVELYPQFILRPSIHPTWIIDNFALLFILYVLFFHSYYLIANNFMYFLRISFAVTDIISTLFCLSLFSFFLDVITFLLFCFAVLLLSPQVRRNHPTHHSPLFSLSIVA